MFTVTFVRADLKPDEIYYYHAEVDARYHLGLFRNDDSGLYRIIKLEKTDGKQSTLIDSITF